MSTLALDRENRKAKIMAASAADMMGKVDWWSGRPRRTQAMPKRSLFGTNMENVNKEELKNIKGRYIPEGYIQPQKDRYPLPEGWNSNISGLDTLESSREDVEQQKNMFVNVDNKLRDKAMHALSFKDSQSAPAHGRSSQPPNQRPAWLTEDDIKHAKDINIVGLNERGSFNRDKYGMKPKRHNYSLIGDIMAKNMDFKSPRSSYRDNDDIAQAYKVGRRARQHKLPRNITDDSGSNEPKGHSLVDLPPNIRHMFGARMCDSLLGDRELVDQALERQKANSAVLRPSKPGTVQGLPVDLKSNYDSLGQAMRYNMFPGLTTEHTISRLREDFNDTVHLRRDPCTDEFRYQRDELSTWSEHNVLRDRMKKAWNEAHPLGGKAK